MDIVLVFNGLGNQMSQYALYLQKKSLGQNVKSIFKSTAHNGIELNSLFGIETKQDFFSSFCFLLYYIFSYSRYPFVLNPIRKILNILGVHAIIENGVYSFHPEVLQPHRGLTIIYGGWHHYKYINDIWGQLTETFKFPAFTDKRNISIANNATNPNHVAIHIRRGDYVKIEKFASVCSPDYYLNGIKYFEERIESPTFYVFSNDTEWSRNLLDGHQAVFVDWNKNEKSWADLVLMSLFQNIIIANSTFSMWAARMGSKNKNVVCPPYFVGNDLGSDIYMPKWTRIQG